MTSTTIRLSEIETTPYVAARGKAVNEREILAQKIKLWQAVTSVALLFSLSLYAHVWQIENKRTVEVVYAQTDATGLIVSGRELGSNDQEVPLSVLMPTAIQRWVMDAFSVSSDTLVQEQWRDHAYAQVSGQAYEILDMYHREHNPFTIAESQTIAIKITDLQQLSPESWLVRWEEMPQSRQGRRLPVIKNGALLTVSHVQPTSTKEALKNLEGLMITNIEWRAM